MKKSLFVFASALFAPGLLCAAAQGPALSENAKGAGAAQRSSRLKTGGACREAIGLPRDSALENAHFKEGLLRLYDSGRKKKAKKSGGRDALESFVQGFIEEGESRQEIFRRVVREGFITENSSLFNLMLNQPAETVASMAAADPLHFKVSPQNPLPLFAAVLTGDRRLAEVFLRKNPSLIHATNSMGEGLLHYVTSEETAVFLMEQGADPNLQDKKGFAPLHHAQSHAVAKAFLEGGASYDLKDRSGQFLVRYHENRLSDLKSRNRPGGEGASSALAAREALDRERGEREKIVRLLHAARDRSKELIIAATKNENPPSAVNNDYDPEKAQEAARRREAAAADAAAAAAERERLQKAHSLRNQERHAARTAEAARLDSERAARQKEEEKSIKEQQSLTFLFMKRWQALDPSQYQILDSFLREMKRKMIRASKKQLKRSGADLKALESQTNGGERAPLSLEQREDLQKYWKWIQEKLRGSAKKTREIASAARLQMFDPGFSGLVTKHPELYLRDLKLLAAEESQNSVLLVIFHVLEEQVKFIEVSGALDPETLTRLKTTTAEAARTLADYVTQEVQNGNWEEAVIAGFQILNEPDHLLRKKHRRLLPKNLNF